jgi:hypothetical protein
MGMASSPATCISDAGDDVECWCVLPHESRRRCAAHRFLHLAAQSHGGGGGGGLISPSEISGSEISRGVRRMNRRQGRMDQFASSTDLRGLSRNR